jgi:hypothetical protein
MGGGGGDAPPPQKDAPGDGTGQAGERGCSVRPFPAGRRIQVWLTATARPALTSAPMKLKKAASSTATVGVSALVRTATATEVETSRNPLRKANTAARSTTVPKMNGHLRIP